MRAGEWSSQIRRGTLELCVLALIAGKPRYGYDLVSALERWEPLATTEGPSTPCCRRLQREGKVRLVAGVRGGTSAQVLPPSASGA